MTISRRRWVLVFAGLLVCGSYAGTPTPVLIKLLEAHPIDLRAMFAGERLVKVFGAAMATDSDPLTTPEEFVTAFLAANPGVLGIDNAALVFRDRYTINEDNPKAVITYTQTIEGLPVHAAHAKALVLLGPPTDTLTYLGMRLVPPPAAPLPADVLTAADAVNLVSQYPAYSGLTTWTTPELVIYEAAPKKVHRVWRFFGSGPTEAYRFFVRTWDGNLLAVQDAILDDVVSGSVRAYATPGLLPDSPGNPPVIVDLPGAPVTLLAPLNNPPCPSDDGQLVGFQFADPFTGAFSFPNVSQSVRVLSGLRGQWAIVDPEFADEQLACEPVVVSIAGGPDPDPVFPTLNPPPHTSQTTAQVNAFLGVEFTRNHLRELLPKQFTGIDQPIRVVTDWNPFCQAGYTIPDPILQFADPTDGRCNNPCYASIVGHEFGHHLVEKVLGPSAHVDYHEAMADVVAAFVWDSPIIGPDFWTDGRTHTFIRDLEQPDVRLQESSTLPAWCNDGNDPHCRGLALGGALWDLRTALLAAFPGIEDDKILSLILQMLFVSDGRLDNGVLVELLAVDDNNATLSDGTLWSSIIIPVFELHGWEQPITYTSGSIVVDWVGPITGPPVEGVDYRVDPQLLPRNVELLTTEKDGLPVETWLVGRQPSVTNGLVRALGDVTATWAAPADLNITVEVGTQLPVAACREVDRIDIPAQEPGATWSSLKLRQIFPDAALHVGATCYADAAGAGGRISGTGIVNYGLITAHAIGEGADEPGELQGSRCGGLDLATIPAGSVLRSSAQDLPVTLSGELAGSVVLGSLGFTVPTRYEQDGRLVVEGFGASPGSVEIGLTSPSDLGLIGGVIEIAGPYSGTMTIGRMSIVQGLAIHELYPPRIATGQLRGTIHLLQDQLGAIDVAGGATSSAAVLIEGDLTGTVSVAGEFNGNLCAANLSPGGPLPANVAIPDFGCDGRICGVGPLSAAAAGCRYLAVTAAPVLGDQPVALRVSRAGCPALYVQAPESGVAELGPSPVSRTPSEWGTVYVTGESIVPDRSYIVEAEDGSGLRCPRTAVTPVWGDVITNNPGIVDLDDILCVLDAFTALQSGACTRFSADLQGCGPDGTIDLDDILAVLDAFATVPFPCPDPCGP